MEDAIQALYAEVKRLGSDPEYAKAAFIGKPDGNPVPLGPRVKSPDEWVDDMISGAKNRAGRWLKNTLSPKKNPKAAALLAAGKYENNTRQSLDEKRWPKAMEGYDEVAREAVINSVGAGGFSDGVERHRPKAVSKIAKLQPLITAVALANDKAKVDTEADRDAKMIRNLHMMRQVGKILKGVASGSPEAAK